MFGNMNWHKSQHILIYPFLDTSQAMYYLITTVCWSQQRVARPHNGISKAIVLASRLYRERKTERDRGSGLFNRVYQVLIRVCNEKEREPQRFPLTHWDQRKRRGRRKGSEYKRKHPKLKVCIYL